MGITETLIIYGLVGLAVATSIALARGARPTVASAGLFAAHTACWPFFAPILFGGALDPPPGPSGTDRDQGDSAVDGGIALVEARLLASLDRVSGIAGELLGSQAQSVRALSKSLADMERRIAEMDELLASAEFDRDLAEQALHQLLNDPTIDDGDARVVSVQSRLRNIDRLHTMRHQTRRDLHRALLQMEEMNSQLLLLQFADQHDDEITRDIQEIASTLDGLCEGLLIP